jgi:hypothetical protein
MPFPHHPSDVPSGSDVVGTPAPVPGPHAADNSITDTLIGAVRACTPDYPPSVDYARGALIDYVDAAQARGEAPERITAAVRFMTSTILTSAVWSGENRDQARELIRTLVGVCTTRLATTPTTR